MNHLFVIQKKMSGIRILYGDSYFTCRIVTDTGFVYYNDGLTTRCVCAYEGHLSTLAANDFINVSNQIEGNKIEGAVSATLVMALLLLIKERKIL